jgi:hypothetical protein
MTEKQRWAWLATLAAAMAWVESAVVVYLRTLIGRVEPYQANPLPVSVGLGQIELVREAATMIMLLAAGWLAGRTRRSRWAYALVAFGVWDILYYVFLKVMIGWPSSLLSWDVLFLLPLPWWGPVLAPALIALLMIVGGTLVARYDHPDRPLRPSRAAWLVGLAGVALALYTFMADAIAALPDGATAVRETLPRTFHWPLFLVAFALLAVPVLDLARQVWRGRPPSQVADRQWLRADP